MPKYLAESTIPCMTLLCTVLFLTAAVPGEQGLHEPTMQAGRSAPAMGLCPASSCVDGDCELTQSLDTANVLSSNMVACTGELGTTENGWARCFNLAAEGVPAGDFTVNSVTFGVELATIDGINVNVNLYLDADGCPPTEPGVDAILLANQPVVVNTADEGTLITVDFPDGPVVLDGTDLIVEIEQVDDGQDAPQFSFHPGGNDAGQCGPTYIRAAQCELPGWIALGDIGFPDSQLILTVSGTVDVLAVPASIDIKPGSCPNSFNRNSSGVLPVALVGTADFDVGDVDISSVLISRADGVGGSAAAFQSSADDDEATPFEGKLCDCHELEGDGILDLGLKFVSNDVVAALQLDGLPNGDLVELVVSGTLLDGTKFEGSDCIRLVPPGTPPGMMSVESNVSGVFIDVAPLDDTLDGDGFTDFERTYSLGTIVTLTAPQTHPGWVFDRWDYDRGDFSGLTAPYLGGFGLQTVGRTIEIIILDGEFSPKAIYRLDEDH